MARKISEKPFWAVEKHAAALGRDFSRCAGCPGTTGKVVDGKMGCSRAGATLAWLTPAEAQGCDGSKPVLLKDAPKDAWPLKTATRRIGQLSPV